MRVQKIVRVFIFHLKDLDEKWHFQCSVQVSILKLFEKSKGEMSAVGY